jgi:hypothetical protein
MTKAEREEKVARYRVAREQMRQLEKEYVKIGKEFFKDECRRLFEETPQLIDFGWRQYTPYFNDGEPCTFRCNTDDAMVNGYDPYSGDDPDEPDLYPELTEKQQEALANKVAVFLHDFGETEFRKWFGEHVIVRIDRKGVHVEEYHHD